MRVLVFLLVSATAHFLVARWVLAVFPQARARRRWVFAIAGGLSLVLATLRVLGWRFQGPFFHDVLAIAMVELAVVVVSLAPLGLFALASRVVARAFDAVRPPADAAVVEARVGRREAVERLAGVTIACASSGALGWGMVRGRHAFAIEEVPIVVPGWPRALDGYVVAQVSDVHVGAFVGDRELDEGFELVRRVRPDLVVATGDLVDHDADRIGELIARLLGVGARDGAYAILGNHDHYAGAAAVAESIRQSKVRLLLNSGVHLRRGDGGGFALLGVDDLQGRKMRTPGHAGPDLAGALAELSPDVPRVLLAHQPRYFLESQGRVALQLSGHTHGGQINPGFRPAAALMEFVAGRYDRGGSTLYVNRGFGVTGPPARVAAPPEITKLVLIAG
ncbi:MAG: metallophosphoesterase [Labilithrix sp.]|nr:metallophosphoesterase [Labilithrix sp.]